MRRSAWFALLAVLGAGSAAGCGSPSAPAMPAYDTDVRPILMVHCVRCHGAGGMQNVALEPTGPNAPVLASIRDTASELEILHGFFDQYGQTGDCTADQNGQVPADCKYGAFTYGPEMPSLIKPGLKPDQQMPPPPAPVLDDWAIQTISNWVNNNDRACSNLPNPDPAICPPGT